MPFTKGDPNIHRAGRPKGSKDKKTKEIKEMMVKLCHDMYPQLVQDLKDMDPRDRVAAMINLMKHFVPKSSTETELRVLEAAQVPDQGQIDITFGGKSIEEAEIIEDED